MNPLYLTAPALGLMMLQVVAGPYAPAAGQAGSTAVHRTDSRFVAWASRVVSYQVGTDCLPLWQDPAKSLGPAQDDPSHITCLGAGGSITLAFPGFIKDGPGADFVVFENSFLDDYIEHAWIEVSRDGVNFVRFPNHSLTATAVGSFGVMDPTEVQGLGSKYRQPFGEPYDLADVGLDSVSHVRLVDVIGDGTARDSANRVIHDPFPNEQSAGFDLDAVGVLNLQTWQSQVIGTFLPDAVNASAFAHLPDGRFLLGLQGQLSVQTTWALPGRTGIGGAGLEFDPAFIAVRGTGSALLGAGGGFGGASGLHAFQPDNPALSLQAAPLASLQNFSGVWWQSPSAPDGGWLVAGTNGPTGKHNITFISADGTRSGPVTAELSTFSSGIATDAGGNVYAALYELSGPDAEAVLKFSASQMENAVAAVLIQSPAPIAKASGIRLYQFDSASSIAVDAAGRVWGSGFKTNQLQVYDPSTGASRRIVPDHVPLAAGTAPLYQVQAFTRGGEPWMAYLVQDEAGTPGSPVIHGIAPLSHLPVPESIASWRNFHFGGVNLTAVNEASLWGNEADPDGDGIVNLLEYALTSPPLSPNSSPIMVGQSGGRLTLTFPRNAMRPDVSYKVEVSANAALNQWTTVALGRMGGEVVAVAPALPRITESGSGAVITVTLRDAQVMTSQARRFMRLRVNLEP